MAEQAERELLDCFRRLGAGGRRELLALARRLEARERAPAPAPAQETVVAAIRRLARAHPGLNRPRMLELGARALEAHALEGRPAEEVIGELEAAVGRLLARAGG